MSILILTLPEKIRYAISMLLSKFINGKKQPKNLSINRILIFKEDEIGDLCYSLHVFTMLKKQYPNAEITLLCKPFAVSLTKTNPNLHLVTSNYTELSGTYDVIVDLRGTWKSLWFALKNRPKFRVDRGTIRLSNKKQGKHPHEVITNLQIVSTLVEPNNQSTSPKIYLNDDNKQKALSFINENGLDKFAVLHTGARKQLRLWDKYDLLATHLHQNGYKVVFAGDKNDIPLIEQWQSKLSFETYSIAGLFNLTDFAALVSKATIYIGNESGPLHIAAVCSTPSIGLFGPGEPHVFYPWGDHTRVVHHILPCNPCGQKNCIQTIPCISLISIDEVISQIKTLTT